MRKLPGFIEKRRQNFSMLYEGLEHLKNRLILPESCPEAIPSWFGFPITCREPGMRDKLVRSLEAVNIQTRMLFAGNLVRHPCFDEMRRTSSSFRTVGTLSQTDRVVADTFWIGVYPGLSYENITYMVEQIEKAVSAQWSG